MHPSENETKEAEILFNCAPNHGILDAWLPILSSIKSIEPTIKLYFLAPRARIIDDIDLDSDLFKRSCGLFDGVVFKTHTDAWAYGSSFDEAKRISRKNNAMLSRAVKKLKITYLGMLLLKLEKSLFASPAWRNNERKTFCSQPRVLLFDMSETKHDYVNGLLETFNIVNSYSLLHGMTVHGLKDNEAPNIQTLKRVKRLNVKAFLYSRQEKRFYQNFYDLDESQISVVGIPRHAKNWVGSFTVNDKSATPIVDTDYILVISRPGNTKYFSRSQKVEAIKDIKNVAQKLNKKIIVKKHPKEKNDGLFDKVLGRERRGADWDFSNRHAFVLAQKCLFAVSFYSGVSVDLIRMGVPCIERLDLKGVKEYDNAESLRDSSGEPVLDYRYLGLVLGASDSVSFMRKVDYVIRDRDRAVDALQKVYENTFRPAADTNDQLASEIIARL